jgi:hypothetical protein
MTLANAMYIYDHNLSRAEELYSKLTSHNPALDIITRDDTQLNLDLFNYHKLCEAYLIRPLPYSDTTPFNREYSIVQLTTMHQGLLAQLGIELRMNLNRVMETENPIGEEEEWNTDSTILSLSKRLFTAAKQNLS